MLHEHVRRQLLSRGCFVENSANDRLGAAVLKPAGGQRDHKKRGHLHARTQSGCQNLCKTDTYRSDCVVNKDIVRGVVIVEISARLNFQTVMIEPCLKSYFTG